MLTHVSTAHRSPRITVVSKNSTQLWSELEARAGEHFELKALGLTIAVDVKVEEWALLHEKPNKTRSKGRQTEASHNP